MSQEILLFLLHLAFQGCVDKAISELASTQAHNHALVQTTDSSLLSLVTLFQLTRSGHLDIRSASLGNNLCMQLSGRDEFGISNSLTVIFIRKHV